MPYSITTKDGITLRNIPDEIAQDAPELRQRVEKIRQESRAAKVAEQQAADRETYNPTKGMSTTDKVLSGVGAGMAGIGRALGLGGLAEKFGLPGSKEEAEQINAPLMKTAAGKVGNVAGQAALVAPTMLIPGANTAVGAGLIGAGTGALTTEGGVKDRALGAALGAGGSLAGKFAGEKIGKALGNYVAKDAAATTAGAQKAAAVQAAQEAGYVLPPTEVRSTMGSELLEGLSGKIKTAQSASAKNQAVTNSLAKKALGVAEDAPLTRDALAGIRKGAGAAYESIKGVGRLEADDAYKNSLSAIKAQYEGAAKDFPGLARSEVSDLVESVNMPSFGADSAIDAIRVLRESADKAFRAGDASIGKANKDAAKAMEDLIERNLAGDAAKLAAFRDARKTIAKTYSVEKALNLETGDVSAPALAALLKKGKPLSGELETIARTATAFPRATQSLKEGVKALSPLDYMAAGAGGIGAGPVGLAALAARPMARSAILSKPYQSLIAPKTKADALARLIQSSETDVPERLAPALAALLAANAGQ